MCKTRRVFQVLVMFLMQMCLGIFIFQILIILRLRFKLVNDRNARTGKKFYPESFFQKLKKMRGEILKFLKNHKHVELSQFFTSQAAGEQ
jgi:hypothetical protein